MSESRIYKGDAAELQPASHTMQACLLRATSMARHNWMISLGVFGSAGLGDQSKPVSQVVPPQKNIH
ncbi:hypothetical protein M413DRAFT_443252 [Hebeloma cylindrosporum]|uniref:Uncharacterized protein n=1 Tax=Hebeloma cylindrosporum TaxID=76867 RepID=A0A0C3CKC2_HEBCY|nr:hypothetical protein M413DRAFT_443252 [Hebeloma cylindrosporum h7]